MSEVIIGALGLAGLGAAAGLVASGIASRIARAALPQAVPLGIPILAVVTGGIALVTIAACYLPALRLSRTDPMVTLRGD